MAHVRVPGLSARLISTVNSRDGGSACSCVFAE